ncbi:hypothetical protein C8E00_102171 [Chromohalobacter marismortui]|uniref:Uncharacterized protein n=1 Tax=Chromohalobacter marismortui TaxID=42055 RepID=A0A4R7NSL4_9GAMM|nr:hypothetical protein C8E00_102171 [Chromohalobacter marismortui]
MIPDSLRQLLDATQGQRDAEWQGRRVLLINADWGELAVSLQGARCCTICLAAPKPSKP